MLSSDLLLLDSVDIILEENCLGLFKIHGTVCEKIAHDINI